MNLNQTSKTTDNIDREIVRTTDYDSLQTLPGNRPVGDTHLRGIIRSIEANGSWLQDEPIIVNDRLEVIDGQHRLEAHRQLQLPIYYTVVSGLGLERAHAMNRARRNWTILDWAQSYANMGNLNYIRFFELLDENSIFPPITIVSACTDKPLSKQLVSGFRTGKFVLSEDAAAQAQKRLNNLTELAELAPNFMTPPVQRFMLQVFRHPRYDQETMVKRMTAVGVENFTASPYIGTVLAQVERAYNRGVELHNMVRFL